MRFILDENHKEIVVTKTKELDLSTQRYTFVGNITINDKLCKIYNNNKSYIFFNCKFNWYKTSNLYLKDIVLDGNYKVK
jgi:hypothetical protein